jgi:predicted Zn-dependent protease
LSITEPFGRENGPSLVFGTPEYPIVVKTEEGIYRRVARPERPQQLNTQVYSDETISENDQQILNEAMTELFNTINLDTQKLRFYGNWRSKNYINSRGELTPYESIEWVMKKNFDSKRNKYRADSITLDSYNDPYQYRFPHWEVIFTKRDLFVDGCDWVFAAARPDLSTIISLNRFEKFADDPKVRSELIRTLVFHEFGHVLGLPSARRGRNLEESIGTHCTSKGCSMHQALSITDFINITTDRLRNTVKGKPYCSDCMNDLRVKFKKIIKI